MFISVNESAKRTSVVRPKHLLNLFPLEEHFSLMQKLSRINLDEKVPPSPNECQFIAVKEYNNEPLKETPRSTSAGLNIPRKWRSDKSSRSPAVGRMPEKIFGRNMSPPKRKPLSYL